NCTGTPERLIASSFIGRAWPPETVAVVVELSMCKPAQAAMRLSTSLVFVTYQLRVSGGAFAVAALDLAANSFRNSNNFGTDAGGSVGTNVVRICFTFSAIPSPFGTRPQVVSIPSNRLLVIGAPSSSLKYSLRAPRRGGLPTP